MHELILGGAKSGKSRCAQARAARWLAQPGHRALLVATALPGDDEMRRRIARHRAERARELPALETIEVPRRLPDALRTHGDPRTLLVVDCLTLWLTQCLMPPDGPPPDEPEGLRQAEALCVALHAAPGPVVLVSNEIGLGVAPLGPETRRFLDTLGLLHQRLAALCGKVTLMVAGIEMKVKA